MHSALRFLAAALLFALCSALPQTSFGTPDEPAHGLFDRIAKAQKAGYEFRSVSLFAPAGGASHSDILKQESLLLPIGAEVSDLFQSKPDAVSLTLHTAAGQAYTLLMLRSYPTPDKPDMGVYDAQGRHRCSYDPGLHYQGIVNGEMHSLAALSIFENGEVMGLFANREGNFNLGKLEDGSGRYILYNDKDMLHHPATACATQEDEGLPQPAGITTAKQANALECNKVRLYWEVDSTVYRYKVTLANTQNYVTGLFNQFQAMYANEHIAVELSSMYIWTGLSIYPTSSSRAGLYTFTSFWNNMGGGFNGDLGHLLMRTNNGNGGVAWLRGLCGTGFSYAYSDVHGSYATLPTFSWDVEVVTHETGHNLSSNHTHWCGWMTNSGSCGAIDNCYTLETSTCNCTYSQYSNSAPVSSWTGTVMSYCHLVSRGINLANGFGPLPGNAIRNYVSTASCLAPTIGATLTPSAICSNDGAVMLQLAGSQFGTAPYIFSWNNGAHTQNLAGLNTPGNYTVSISDSNGCQNSFTTTVKTGRSSGNGIAPQIAMPVCCNRYNAPLVLTASAPKGLTACQSVYWLRSEAPFASAAAAMGYFDTASTANVLRSSNESAIANGVTGAELEIIPESCNVAKTWYYTPVVAQLPHIADSFSYTTAGSSSFLSYNNVRIGSETTIPDQRSAPAACDLLDEPTLRSLRVTVTGYTGRPNRMRIFIADVNGLVIYQSQDLPGNGSYDIPDSLIAGDFLQGMDIVAFDYNCVTNVNTFSTTCVSSQCNVSAQRKVVFGAHPAKLTTDCALGQSIRVDWAPAGCTQLSVAPEQFISGMKVLPNPASSSATLHFSLAQGADLQWIMSDMAGRVILRGGGYYGAGTQQARINLQSVARGIYVISLSEGGANAQRTKLIVE